MPTPHNRSFGAEGEEYACGYLVEKAYTIVARNVRMSSGELDIIAIAPDKTLVFIEVKTVSRGNSLGVSPEDQMTGGKIRKFKRVAYLYANAHEALIDGRAGWRLDVIALTRAGSEFKVVHYENIE